VSRAAPAGGGAAYAGRRHNVWVRTPPKVVDQLPALPPLVQGGRGDLSHRRTAPFPSGTMGEAKVRGHDRVQIILAFFAALDGGSCAESLGTGDALVWSRCFSRMHPRGWCDGTRRGARTTARAGVRARCPSASPRSWAGRERTCAADGATRRNSIMSVKFTTSVSSSGRMSCGPRRRGVAQSAVWPGWVLAADFARGARRPMTEKHLKHLRVCRGTGGLDCSDLRV
jgi:hypothetical protein